MAVNSARLDTITKKAIEKKTYSILAILRKKNPLTGDQWANKHFYLSEESSIIKGQWKSYPWQKPILNMMTNDSIRSFVMMKSMRVGYTKMVMIAIGYYKSQKNRKVAIWQPTDGAAKEFSLVELDTMIRDVKVVRENFPFFEKKSSQNTISYKGFLGSPLYIRGGHVAGNFRRITLDVAILDEYAGFQPDIDAEGEGRQLAAGRLEGSPYGKEIIGSTPKIKGECLIEKEYKAAEVQLQYYFDCPHCGESQPIDFGGRDTPYGFKWIDNNHKTVKYLCRAEDCGALITQTEFEKAMHQESACYKDEKTGVKTYDGLKFYDDLDNIIDAPEHIGAYIWAAYNPLVRWHQIVKKWLDSCKDPIKTKTFINTTLGKVYDQTTGDKADKAKLESRTETYKADPVPEKVCYITAGVDQQGDRFEVQIIGWGIGQESWVLEYIVLPCDPTDESSWNAVLDPVLNKTYDHPNGRKLKISFSGIDTGGHATQQAYKYCKENDRSGKLALKGMAGNRPIIPIRPSTNFTYKGTGSLKGWIVGTDTAKMVIYTRLDKEKPGEGYIHFSKDRLPEWYFNGLTVEVRIAKIKKTGKMEHIWWCPPGARNEPLDTFVYALAALEHASIDLSLVHKNFNDLQPTLDLADLHKQLNS